MNPELAFVEDLARRAGEILRRGYGKEHQVRYKDVIDPVTEVDHESEKFLLGEIQACFPGHQIAAEEKGLLPGSEMDQWFIDPLDGTVNFAHHIPIFSVSIGYAHAGRMRLGVVYDPMRDELFSAEKGRGAHCNGMSLQASKETELQRSLLVTGFPYDPSLAKFDNLEFYSRFARLSQGVRRMGSAALDMCYIAAGRFEGYWEQVLNTWDLAAGTLIAAEAGAVVTDLDGGDDYLTYPCSLLTANATIHAKMLKLLRSWTAPGT